VLAIHQLNRYEITHKAEGADIQLSIVEHCPHSVSQGEQRPPARQPWHSHRDLLFLPPKDLEPIKTPSKFIKIFEVLSIHDQRSRPSCIGIQRIMSTRHHLREFDIRLNQTRKVVLRVVAFSRFDFAEVREVPWRSGWTSLGR
jgi:hypothetical protein